MLIKTAFCIAALLSFKLAGAADLTIEVTDVKSDAGQLMVAIYNSAGDFLKKPAGATMAKAAPGANKIVIKDLPPGDYAYAVYHDANSNGKMDRNLMGIPTEDYAFSNNVVGKMGPPSYDSAKFTLPAAGASVTVSVR